MYEDDIEKLLLEKGEPLSISEVVDSLKERLGKAVVYETVKNTLKGMGLHRRIRAKGVGKGKRVTWIFWAPKSVPKASLSEVMDEVRKHRGAIAYIDWGWIEADQITKLVPRSEKMAKKRLLQNLNFIITSLENEEITPEQADVIFTAFDTTPIEDELIDKILEKGTMLHDVGSPILPKDYLENFVKEAKAVIADLEKRT